VRAEASDPSGVSGIELYLDGVPVGSGAGAAYDYSWNTTQTPNGVHQWIAKATDPGGNLGTSATVLVGVSNPLPATLLLVPRVSVWKYRDLGEDLGTAWRAPGYADGSWSSGPGVLGYGESYVATVVSYGPAPNRKYWTTYFRRPFVVTGAANVTALRLRVMYDDGAVVYLNGVEVARPGMPGGTIAYSTRASAKHLANATYEEIDLGAFVGLLVEGTNVIAAEVHQRDQKSNEMIFDAEIEADVLVPAPNVAAPDPGGHSATASLRTWPVPYAGGDLTVTFSASGASGGEHVELAIYDPAGRRVRSLASGGFANGEHRVHWDGRDDSGARVAAGIYLLKARREDSEQVRKLVIVR
jgi:hypothetical protein